MKFWNERYYIWKCMWVENQNINKSAIPFLERENKKLIYLVKYQVNNVAQYGIKILSCRDG